MSVQLFDYTYLIMKQTMRTTLSLVVTLLYVAILFGTFLLFTRDAYAQVGIPASGVELTGYAWSDNIGWISMNCRTGGVTGNDICGTSSYRVTLATGGALTGYAWSSNIGWVKFDGLSSFPALAGTVAASARVTGTYPNLTIEGWARACAGTVPGDCSDMASRTDGWDGWISLRSTVAPTYSTIMSATGALNNSFAWGSAVVGWIDFDQTGLRLPTATLSGAGCTIALGASTCDGSFTWIITDATSPNVRNTTRSLTYASVAAGTNALHPITFGDNTIQARDNTTVINPPGDVTVTGLCPAGADFTSGTCQTSALPAPAITISTSRAIVRAGEAVRVTWTLTPSPVASGSCALTGPGMPSSVTTSGNQTSSALRSKTRFNITCTGPYGSVSTSTLVELIPVAKEV